MGGQGPEGVDEGDWEVGLGFGAAAYIRFWWAWANIVLYCVMGFFLPIIYIGFWAVLGVPDGERGRGLAERSSPRFPRWRWKFPR
jgi:hypothetical protein